MSPKRSWCFHRIDLRLGPLRSMAIAAHPGFLPRLIAGVQDSGLPQDVHDHFPDDGVGFTNDFPMMYLRIKQKSVLCHGISLTKLIINLSLNILFIVHFKMGAMGVLTGGILANTAIGLVLIPLFVKFTGFRFSLKTAIPMLVYGFPLLGNWLGMFIINFSDRFILQNYTNLTRSAYIHSPTSSACCPTSWRSGRS